MNPWPGLFIAFLAGVVSPVSGGTLEGRFALEMEYLGESYFSELQLTALDLDLALNNSLVVSDTTRFTNDTWLPGQRLELTWRNSLESRARFQIYSRTAFNHERFSQDIEFLGEVPGQRRGRWLFRMNGSLRDDDRSLVGHGDWLTRVEMTREVPFREKLSGGFRIGWDHSRTRGDSVSYLYDFDLLRARLFASGGGSWLPGWETLLEGKAKIVPRGEPGGYREAHLGGVWRQSQAGRTLLVDARIRDYDQDEAVGRDYWSGELTSWNRLWGSSSSSLNLEAEGVLVNYRGEDELYFDSAELTLRLPWKQSKGNWSLGLGPVASFLSDLGDGNRDFRQWSARGSLNRLFGLGGFGDLSLETGYRDYRSESADVIEVSSLSTSIIRSDYWLVDILALLNLPVGGRISIDFMASTSWELHTAESERIHVTFANLGFSKAF
jgi:hypothetical protein